MQSWVGRLTRRVALKILPEGLAADLDDCLPFDDIYPLEDDDEGTVRLGERDGHTSIWNRIGTATLLGDRLVIGIEDLPMEGSA